MGIFLNKKPTWFNLKFYEFIKNENHLDNWKCNKTLLVENLAFRCWHYSNGKSSRDFIKERTAVKQKGEFNYKYIYRLNLEKKDCITQDWHEVDFLPVTDVKNSTSSSFFNVCINLAFSRKEILNQIDEAVKARKNEFKYSINCFKLERFINNKYLEILDLLIFTKLSGYKITEENINKWVFHGEKKKSILNNIKNDALDFINIHFVNYLYQDAS